MDVDDDTIARSPRDEDKGNSAVGARNPLCVRHPSPRMLGQQSDLDNVDLLGVVGVEPKDNIKSIG